MTISTRIKDVSKPRYNSQQFYHGKSGSDASVSVVFLAFAFHHLFQLLQKNASNTYTGEST